VFNKEDNNGRQRRIMELFESKYDQESSIESQRRRTRVPDVLLVAFVAGSDLAFVHTLILVMHGQKQLHQLYSPYTKRIIYGTLCIQYKERLLMQRWR
jgi:hypothetical protein